MTVHNHTNRDSRALSDPPPSYDEPTKLQVHTVEEREVLPGHVGIVVDEADNDRLMISSTFFAKIIHFLGLVFVILGILCIVGAFVSLPLL